MLADELNLVLRSCNQPVVVGISGVTCGGKSTLKNMFSDSIKDAKSVCQDDFYFPCEGFNASVGCTYPNFDSIESVDMESFMKQVSVLKSEIRRNPESSCKLIILEGFALFNYEPVARICDLNYFITLSYEECLARRKRRNRSPPEPDGYFERIAWPMYISNLEEINRSPFAKSIEYLDGNNTLEDNFCKIAQDVVDLVTKRVID